MHNFEYLIEKIKSSKMKTEPFKHIYIENFFNDDDFNSIIDSFDVKLRPVDTDIELFNLLSDSGYKPISFPGCVTDVNKYLKWRSGSGKVHNHKTCESFGVVQRLYHPQSKFVEDVINFFGCDDFNKAIADRFDIDFDQTICDGGLQKYFDGYEISPHPDIRLKAATFMININPAPDSEVVDHHTHYLKFKKEREYIKTFWSNNDNIDRAWVPWSWASTCFQQRKNNSIVIFSPSDDTLHAVKASYNHLSFQRTQLYGNLWYKKPKTIGSVEWQELDLLSKLETNDYKINRGFKNKVKRLVPNKALNIYRSLKVRQIHGKRTITKN